MIGGGQDCHGQSDTTAVDSNGVFVCGYNWVPPEFPGGEDAIYSFISSNMDEKLVLLADTSGGMLVQFKVDTTGQVMDIRIVKSLTEDLDKDLERVISLMPKWTSARHNGWPVDAYFRLPVQIRNKNE